MPPGRNQDVGPQGAEQGRALRLLAAVDLAHADTAGAWLDQVDEGEIERRQALHDVGVERHGVVFMAVGRDAVG